MVVGIGHVIRVTDDIGHVIRVNYCPSRPLADKMLIVEFHMIGCWQTLSRSSAALPMHKMDHPMLLRHT